jgi:hypothetical protein
LCFTSGIVMAEAPRVLLVYPSEAEPSVSAALVRVRGELVADGFEVVLVKAQPGTTSSAAMGEAEHDSGSATVGLFLNADGTSAELWVVDKLTDKTVVRRVDTASEPTAQLSEVLAVRAVELLRASLLEFLVAQRQADARKTSKLRPKTASIAPAAAKHVSEWAARPLQPKPELPWTAEAGLGTVMNPGGTSPAWGLAARLRLPLLQWLQPRLSFVGLGTRPRVSGTGGTATVQQWYGFGEFALLPWANQPIRPFFTIGAGVHHLNVDGDATWPYVGIHSSAWTFAANAGVGVALKLSSRLTLSSEAQIALSSPYPLPTFVGDNGPKLGHPSVIGSLTLAVSL